MEIKRMQLGMIQTNCYIFWDENTLDCAVVDPGDDGEQVAAFIQGRGLNPVAILLTHSHFDHILGIPGLREQWPELPIYCHRADVDETQKTVRMFGSTFPAVSSFGHLRFYSEGDKVTIGPITLEVLETPDTAIVTLRAGKYHQIKRMLAQRGKPVLYLKRLTMGPLTLDPALEKGAWRPLTAEELAALREV